MFLNQLLLAFYITFNVNDNHTTNENYSTLAENISSSIIHSDKFFLIKSSSSDAYTSEIKEEEEEEEIFNTPLQSIFDAFIMSLRDVTAIYNQMKKIKYNSVGKILFVVFLILVHLVLVNMLIASMAHTYDSTNLIKREWIRQVFNEFYFFRKSVKYMFNVKWAKMVLSIEQNITEKEKLRQQLKYTQINNGHKTFIVRWKQNVLVFMILF